MKKYFLGRKAFGQRVTQPLITMYMITAMFTLQISQLYFQDTIDLQELILLVFSK